VQGAKERLRETGHVVSDRLVVKQTSKSLIPFTADSVNIELGDQNDGRSFVDRARERRIDVFCLYFCSSFPSISLSFFQKYSSLIVKEKELVNVSRILCQIMGILL